MTELKRTLSFSAAVFYGVGTIIGAGIYVLIGKVAGAAGLFLPWSFLLAGVIAGFTAITYARMCAYFPQAAGSALYVERAFQRKRITQLVAILVALTGIISAATIANGFVGYLSIFVSVPDSTAIILLVIALTTIACWGITQSVALICLVTLIEIGGLVFVIILGFSTPTTNNLSLALTMPSPAALSGIALGGLLAFYAFIGFEDMVNIAEEVKQPKQNLPRAIIVAVVVSSVLYIAVALAAMHSIDLDTLANSPAPLAALVENAGYSPVVITVISLFAVVNGALVQIIMASRLLYGMAKMNMAPPLFSRLHPSRNTPIHATLLMGSILLIFALWLPLETLAKSTSFIMLLIFSLVNLSLLKLQINKVSIDSGIMTKDFFLPLIALVLCLLLLTFQISSLI
jgi:basic amino acid/polyamine antiporter, APA family